LLFYSIENFFVLKMNKKKGRREGKKEGRREGKKERRKEGKKMNFIFFQRE